MDYQTIKALKVAGQSPDLAQLDAAIKAQEAVVGAAACKLARVQGEHAAAHDMPFELACEEAHEAILDAEGDFNHQGIRLTRLFRWRSLKAAGLR